MHDGSPADGRAAIPTAAQILALFRPRDVRAMARFFDLGSADAVRAHAESIWERVEAGNMPCDRMWQEHELDLFRRWMVGGMP